MGKIVKATTKHAHLIAAIGRASWIEAHGSSATSDHINSYVAQKYTEAAILQQLESFANRYHLIYCDNRLAGYSNILFNATDPNIAVPDVAELDRLYLLSEFYNRKLGLELLNYNIELAKQNSQNGL